LKGGETPQPGVADTRKRRKSVANRKHKGLFLRQYCRDCFTAVLNAPMQKQRKAVLLTLAPVITDDHNNALNLQVSQLGLPEETAHSWTVTFKAAAVAEHMTQSSVVLCPGKIKQLPLLKLFLNKMVVRSHRTLKVVAFNASCIVRQRYEHSNQM
jgi:hypothetical protein